jgi:hypothetical protein
MYQMTQTYQTVPQGEEKKPGLWLPVDLIRRVKVAAAQQGITFKQFAAEALEAKLKADAVGSGRSRKTA